MLVYLQLNWLEVQQNQTRYHWRVEGLAWEMSALVAIVNSRLLSFVVQHFKKNLLLQVGFIVAV
jgi:hypothetical protein